MRQAKYPRRPGSAFLPYLHDMLAMGVPESTAMRWHNAVWLLMSHAENMAECIESQVGGSQRARDAALNARKAMATMRPNAAGQTPAVASRAEPDCSAWFCCSRCGVSGQWSGWVSAFDPAIHRCDTCYAEGKDHELLPVPNAEAHASARSVAEGR